MSPRRIARIAGVLVGYWTLFYLFDSASTVFEVAPGVSTWYPSAGLNLALIVVMGLRFLPAVFVASFVSGLWIADPPLPAVHLILPNLILTLANGAAALWLRRVFTPRHPFTLRTIGAFVGVAVLLPGVVSTLAVASYDLTGLGGHDAGFLSVVTGWWIGDAVGILTLAPPLIIAAAVWMRPEMLDDATLSQLQFRLNESGILSFTAELAIIVGSLYLAFYVPEQQHFQFYVCFLPLLWVALRHGLPRATLAALLLNVGAAVAIRHQGSVDVILEFQFFMLSLALTGLLLGLLVSERQRAARILQEAGRQLERRLGSYGTASAQRGGFFRPVPHSARPNGARGVTLRDSTRDGSTRDGSTRDDASAHADSTKNHAGDQEGDNAGDDPAGASIRGLTDVLTSSSDLLSRSTENLVALNEQLYQSERRLNALNAQKDKFLSLISHDLKNPLVGIRGLAQMLSERDGPEDNRRPLELIERSSQQALDLLDNLLTWARLQTGHFTPEPERHSLHALVDDTIGLLESQASQKDVALENGVDTGLQVDTDPFVADTVLRNLVSNAIKFTEPGGYVSVTARAVHDGTVEVAVADTGVGIPPARRKSLFLIDHQTSTQGTEGESGTGLGLHICHELVECQDGRIWVDSTEEVGTTFYFTLPAVGTWTDASEPTPRYSSVAQTWGGRTGAV